MRVTIIGSCEIGKTLSVKREKETKPGGSTERLVCYLPVADLFVDCETIDAFCGQPRGWARGALYHDTGEPRSKLALEIPDADWTVTGKFGGRAGEPLTLSEASMTGVVLTLTPMGALMAARFTWNTAGDEADDVAELLGRLASADLMITDGEQQDLFAGRPPAHQPPAEPEPDRTTLHFPGLPGSVAAIGYAHGDADDRDDETGDEP